MTSKQYEELCRLFLADKLKTSVDQIVSIDVLSSTRPNQPEYAHQIDLYWEIEDPVSKFVAIANAKWRKPPDTIDLHEVLLLQQVREQIGAHKAVLITNTSYTEGARAAAMHEGIALHIVCPVFDYQRLHATNPVQIQAQLRALAERAGPSPLYVHQVVQKSFGSERTSAADSPLVQQNSSSCLSGLAALEGSNPGIPGGRPFTYPNKSLSAQPQPGPEQSRSASQESGPARVFRYLRK